MYASQISEITAELSYKWTDLQQFLAEDGTNLPGILNGKPVVVESIILVIFLILGLLLIMRGQQLIRLWLILSGALVGSTIGRGIANLINPLSPSLILIGIFTLLGAGLFATLLRGFIVTAGFATGALFAWTFVHAGTPQILGISSILVCAIAGGILAAMAFPWFIRLITAAAGSWMVINAVRTFLLQRPWFAERFAPTFPSAWPLWLLLPMALLTLIGVRLQRKRQKGLR